MSYLVDSDWIIDALASVPATLSTLEELAPDGLSVSIVTFGEVFEGAYGFADPQSRLATFRVFLSRYTVLNLTDPIMEVFAEHRSRLRRQGNLVPDLDLLIAATALHHDLTLVTRNLRHFSRVPGLKLYQPS